MHADCVNVDINQEATAYLVHTAQLSQFTPMGHGGLSDPSSHLESFTLSPNTRLPVGAVKPHTSSGATPMLACTPADLHCCTLFLAPVRSPKHVLS